MTARRIILDFEEKVYCDESRVWYVLDYQATPFVKDIISDVVKNLKCCEGWSLYVNDVLAPEWTLSSVICSEDDSVKLIRMKKCQPMDCSDECADSSNKVITIRDTKSAITTSVNEIANLESPSNQKKPPLKINNNYKRKYCDTTPIHKDKYTNRSRIYVSPVMPKTVPVADALKTAVKETLTFSSPSQKTANQTSKCKTVADSFHKAKTFQDRVTTILNGNSKKSQIDSDSDSSTTSSSSEDDSCKRVAKKSKTEAKSSSTNSSSLPCVTGKIMEKPNPSSSSDTESEPEIIEKQPTEDRDSSSDYKNQNQSQKVRTTKPVFASKSYSTDESSEEESDEEVKSSSAKPPNVPSAGDKNIKPSNEINDESTSESESDSEIEEKETTPKETVSKLVASNCGISKNLCVEESSEDESCEEETKSKLKVSEKKPQQHLETSRQNSLEKDYSNCANLEGTPRVSDRLAFKMLDLNESYCPVISAYKEGIITAYNSSSQSIVVKLLPQFQKTLQKNGRFEMDDGVTSDSIELSLKQLIEPKLICG